MSKLKPCPFCGSDDLKYTSYYVECNNCKALGPDKTDVTTAEMHWNSRVPVVEPPEIKCELCPPESAAEAVYEAWFRRRDPFLGTPTGHLVKVYICEGCKVHPHLCVNEAKKASDGS